MAINSPDLVNVISCFSDGILTDVLFIQSGNITHNSTEISQLYYSLATCSTNLKLTCHPQYGTMNTDTWDLVFQLNLEGSIGTTIQNAYNSTRTFHHHNNINTTSTTSYDYENKTAGVMRLVENTSNGSHLHVVILFALIPLLTLTLLLLY